MNTNTAAAAPAPFCSTNLAGEELRQWANLKSRMRQTRYIALRHEGSSHADAMRQARKVTRY